MYHGWVCGLELYHIIDRGKMNIFIFMPYIATLDVFKAGSFGQLVNFADCKFTNKCLQFKIHTRVMNKIND